MLTYDQAIKYLESFIDYEKVSAPYDPRQWKLERMEHLLELIGNPHHGLKVIHIAGTKGKGSTAAMIASILKEANFKVGLYTSPHLVSFRERIRINGDMISEDRVSSLVTQISPYIDILKNQESRLGNISFFEVYTALAFLYFALEKADFVVLEVGMGGRLDATNVVDDPLVSVITQISFDHMISLGNTISAIAREKAGIIKERGYVITSPQTADALKVIRDTCTEKSALLFEVCKDICFQKHGGSFDILGLHDRYEDLHIPLIGDHQLINATTAVGALEILSFHGFFISPDEIRRGLEKVRWPARIEVINKEPFVILDVAHNAASAKVLREAMESRFSYDNLILVFASSQHKDIKGMGEQICPIASKVILTKVNNPRAMSPEDMREELTGICEEPIITHDTASALKTAFGFASPRDLICIMGSVYLAGEVMQILGISPFAKGS